ncbi:hypothetical protein [Halobacterium zhouii]|uniref:hypothetical protein n=1 Tax=Halobacterium zhouii TaxID=2902624 RepID=UPI001E4FF31E|nr:hypothetical protein [Halobacterium zhouii]
MPSTALHLAVLACVLLAGCSGFVPSATETTPPPSSTGTTPTTTELSENECPAATDYEQKSLPEKPTNFSKETAAKFAAAYEKAFVWNEHEEQAETEFQVNTRVRAVNETDTGYVVQLDGSATYSACSNGAHSVADVWLHTNYFVNETTVIRLAYPENRTTNPRTNGGNVVEH